MKILFISSIYPKEYRDIIRENCFGKVYQSASNAFQEALIEGFCENKTDINLVSFPALPCFPNKYRYLYTFDGDITYKERKIGHIKKFCTLFGIKDFSIQFRLKSYIKGWIKQNRINKTDDFVILTYSPSNYYLNAIKPLKRKYKGLRVCSIVTDLVDDRFTSGFHYSLLKRIQNAYEYFQIKSCYNVIDYFVLLTEAMVEKIPQAKGRHIVVEGIASTLNHENYEKKEAVIKTVLYAGTLHQYSCVDSLVDAFSMTSNPDYRLVICGGGPLEDYITEKAKMDKRIIFKGMLSREEVLQLQKESTVLVNPRRPNQDITKYSFPSKTMEYMSSGTPMIGYQLEGIPQEYYPYIYSPNGLATEEMAELIDEVLSKTSEELRERAISAKQFIEENKSAKKQVAKIISFIEND